MSQSINYQNNDEKYFSNQKLFKEKKYNDQIKFIEKDKG